MSAALSALYNAQPLVLWVEDEATRIILTAAWAGDPVALYIGGSNETIRAVCQDAWRNGTKHVFGVVDRDHGQSNFIRWGTPSNDLRVYVLQSPEIETLALDAPALANCTYNTGRRTEAEIEARITQIIKSMNWWMTCCTVMMTVREFRNEGFPSLPKVGTIGSEAEAMMHLMSSDWFSRVAATLPDYAKAVWIATKLKDEEAKISAAIANNTWRPLISGKEVFRQLSGYVLTTNVPDKHNVLLQAVIQQQVASGVIPTELGALRSSLRGRVGLPP